MQETAESIINDALQELLIQESEQPIQAPDFFFCMRYMNRLMAELDARGVSLGYTAVSNPSDVITIPAGAINGLVFNLAVRIASSYDMPISASLAASAKRGMDAMLNIAVRPATTKMPDILPIGSGNYDYYQYDQFFPSQEPEVLSEDGDAILTEVGT